MNYKKLFFALLLLLGSSILFSAFQTIDASEGPIAIMVGFPFEWLRIYVTPIGLASNNIMQTGLLFRILGFLVDFIICYAVIFAIFWIIEKLTKKRSQTIKNEKNSL